MFKPILWLSLTLLLAACGGGNPPDPNELQEVSIKVSFPIGAISSGATLETPYGSSSLANNAGKVSLSGNGPALASVVKDGKVLLMGFVSPTLTNLSARTTAEAFAFYALNGQFLEPAMQTSLLEFLASDERLQPIATAIEGAVRTSPPNVSLDNAAIKAALNTMRTALGAQGAVGQSVKVSPEHQQSGIFVRETAPLADAINLYNNFRRPVFVYVERLSPQLGPVSSFELAGASVETSSTAQKFQVLTGFAQGDIPRSAVKSDDIELPPVNDQTTNFVLTIVGAGGDALAPGTDSSKAQKARDLALKTAIEFFIAPTIKSALEVGAKPRTAADLAPVLQGISAATLEKIEAGNFEAGLNDAFRELFNSSALPTTIDRILKLYYPGVRSRDSVQNMRERLTRNFAALIGATASSISLSGNGIIGTIRNSKRIESFTVETKPLKLRVRPEQTYLGKGGETILSAELQLPPGESASGITYRWTQSGAGAGYGVDAGTEKAFPFETTNTTVTYKHRDTINVVYGTDTITVEALRTLNGTPTVIAKGSASITVRENVISLSPKTVELALGDSQTFTAKVDPVPTSGTLSYVFVTFGPSSFAGGSQTSIGASQTVNFNQADDQLGKQQTITLSVVLDNAGTQTILGQTEATVSVKDAPSLQNGDFSQKLQFWQAVGNVGMSTTTRCTQVSNPYVYLDVYRNQNAYVQQTFRMPAKAKTLSLRLWNSLDPVLATITLNGVLLDQFTPPSIEVLKDPKDPRSAICSQASPVNRSYDVSSFAGKKVTLRLRGSNAPGNNGTVLGYDDVKVE